MDDTNMLCKKLITASILFIFELNVCLMLRSLRASTHRFCMVLPFIVLVTGGYYSGILMERILSLQNSL